MDKLCTSVEKFVIEAVRRRRETLNITPKELSLKVGLNGDWVNKVENPRKREKYNLNQLHEIARALDCKLADLFPEPLLENDCLKEYQEIRDRKKQERLKLKEENKNQNSKNS